MDLDLSLALKTAEDFEKATNVSCVVLDLESEQSMVYAGCKLCQKMTSIIGQHHNCKDVMMYGSYQAERFGGKYIFFCPFGMVHFASPIVIDGVTRASLVGGPVLMQDKDEFISDDIMEKFHLDCSYEPSLRQCVEDIPNVLPSRVSALSELLFISAAHISDVKYAELLDQQKSIDIQSGISEYVQYLKSLNDEELPKQSYPIEKERQLITYISQGNKAGAQKLLNEILGYIFFSSGKDFDIIKARVLELVVVLSRAAVEGGADVEQIFGLNFKYLQEINEFKNVDQLSVWLSKIMSRFTQCVFGLVNVKHVDVIYKAIDYIRHNYMNKITLEEVANAVYLSPSYFSKIFKEEMKCNFNTYLNKIRIESSKKLLTNEEVNLIEVSSLVGFEDQSYYSKVFKKMTGITPGKYREKRGMNILK